MSAPDADLARRVRVLGLRQRVEACSWRVHTACFALPADRPRHGEVRRRLLLLTGWARDGAELDRLRAAAAELAWVYRQCCDVLHGRRAFTDLPEPVVVSWEHTVDTGERVVAEVLARPAAAPTCSPRRRHHPPRRRR